MQEKGHPISKTLRTEILRAEDDGTVELRFNLGQEFANFFGGVQGGVLSSLLDEACSYAVVASIGVHCFLGTVELHTRILKKAGLGPIQAFARITSASRYIVHAEAQLLSSGILVATGSSVILVDTTRPINESWVAKV